MASKTNNPTAVNAMGAAPKAAGTGIAHLPLILGAVLIIVVAAIAGFILLNQSGSAANPGSGTSPSGQSAPSTPLDKAVAQSSHNFTSISKFISGQLNQTQQFNVTYDGSLGILVSSEPIPITIPIVVSYAKYGNDSRTAIVASGIPEIGSINETTFTQGNASYICSTFTSYNSSSTSPQVTCQNSTASGSSIPLSINNYTNNSAVSVTGSEGSSYNGASCYQLKGTLDVPLGPSAPGSASQSPGLNGAFGTCFSEQYYVPLYINMNGTIKSGNATINLAFSLHEANIGTSVSQAYVTTLPGPVTSADNGTI